MTGRQVSSALLARWCCPTAALRPAACHSGEKSAIRIPWTGSKEANIPVAGLFLQVEKNEKGCDTNKMKVLQYGVMQQALLLNLNCLTCAVAPFAFALAGPLAAVAHLALAGVLQMMACMVSD
jgi:hypothetical protein